MKPVYWHEDAELSLEKIVDFIQIDNFPAAVALAERIIGSVEANLTEHPKMGRPGRVENTRELVVHQNYIVVYIETPTKSIVLDIVHAAQLYP